jgi:hypothetical protein
MQQIIDISGNKYNKLTVLRLHHIQKRKNGTTRTYWECKCDCGNIIVARKDGIIYPYSSIKSCGCWHKEESSIRAKKNKDKQSGKFISNKERK